MSRGRVQNWKNVMRQSICIAKVELGRCFFSTRALLLVDLFIYLKGQISDSLLELTEGTGEPLQLFEPAIAVLDGSSTMLMLPLFFLTVFADFPKTDSDSFLYFSRSGKLSWFMGQVLMSIAGAFVVLVGTMVAVTLPCIKYLSWNDGNWSDAVTKYYKIVNDELNFSFSLIDARTYNQMNPGEALFHNTMLMLLCLVLLAMFKLLFYVYGKKAAGIFVDAVLVVIGNVLCYLEVEKVMWFFPMANTQVWLRHQEILNIQQFPLYLSYVYFIVFLFVTGLLTYVRLKKGNIQSESC